MDTLSNILCLDKNAVLLSEKQEMGDLQQQLKNLLLVKRADLRCARVSAYLA